MRLKILPRRLFVLLSLFSLGFASFGLAQTQQAPIACAQTTYGLNECKVVGSPSNCPYSTTEQSIFGGSYCVNKANRFCELITQNATVSVIGGQAVAAANNFLYCETAPPATIGKCNGVNFEWILPSGHPTRREIQTYLDQFPASVIVNDSSLSRIECNAVDGGTSKVVIPKLDANLYEIFTGAFLYQDIANIIGIAGGAPFDYAEEARILEYKMQRLKIASDIGFNIQNNGSRESIFCPEGAAYFATYEVNGQEIKDTCVEIPKLDAAGNGSCYVNSPLREPLAGGGHRFVKQNACLGRTDDNWYFYDTSFGPKTNFDKLTTTRAASPDLLTCRNNSFTVLSQRSNRGCGPYISVNNDNSVASSEKWRQCAVCLYGENAFVTPEQCQTQGADGFTCPAGPGNTNLIGATLADDRPDLEPLLEPIPGQLFNDLGGCLNTSSTASIVNTLIRIALGLMGAIVIFRIIQGAITMQSGDPESFEEGRAVITSAIMGLLVLILSAAILNFLAVNVLQLNPESGFVPFGG